ncbi:MAG: Lrp/AsnC family transcriptional regulator, partial [Magnetovibrio sp.]|nr:Lrp/AsnC family transcriptional regulator [Magnetovibrio sp.]
IKRLERMLDAGTLSRFGPMYHAERLGGGLSLVAMEIPEDDFDRTSDIVNGFPEVAHNYARDHKFSMWFVLATETPERIEETLAEIEEATGYPTFNMPKTEEFFIGLRLDV